jgi:hypothetical protein
MKQQELTGACAYRAHKGIMTEHTNEMGEPSESTVMMMVTKLHSLITYGSLNTEHIMREIAGLTALCNTIIQYVESLPATFGLQDELPWNSEQLRSLKLQADRLGVVREAELALHCLREIEGLVERPGDRPVSGTFYERYQNQSLDALRSMRRTLEVVGVNLTR